MPAVDQPYDSLLQKVREAIKPDNPRAEKLAELAELVDVVEGNFTAVSAAREALEREQEALAREAGAEGTNLGVLKERLADYQKQRRDYEFGLAAFKDDCEEFVPFLERLLNREI